MLDFGNIASLVGIRDAAWWLVNAVAPVRRPKTADIFIVATTFQIGRAHV